MKAQRSKSNHYGYHRSHVSKNKRRHIGHEIYIDHLLLQTKKIFKGVKII